MAKKKKNPGICKIGETLFLWASSWEYTTVCKVTQSMGLMCMDSFTEPQLQ